jgi:hypothetical protein
MVFAMCQVTAGLFPVEGKLSMKKQENPSRCRFLNGPIGFPGVLIRGTFVAFFCITVLK